MIYSITIICISKMVVLILITLCDVILFTQRHCYICTHELIHDILQSTKMCLKFLLLMTKLSTTGGRLLFLWAFLTCGSSSQHVDSHSMLHTNCFTIMISHTRQLYLYSQMNVCDSRFVVF